MSNIKAPLVSRNEKIHYGVPFVNPREHYRRLKNEIDGAIIGCLEQGDLIHRQQLFDFEKHLAEYVGVKYAVGLNSGYHALHFSLLAAHIGPGDEVITVAHTFAATVSAIIHCGASPVLVDVGPDYNMDLSLVERAVTKKTKAIIPVHLNGRLCDMDRLMSIANRHRLAVVEDACQSLGATFQGKMAGSFGVGCFSFYPFKALGGFGDGGALTTNDPEIARIATLLRYNGEDRNTGEFFYHGYTALLDNVQAAVLDVKLKHFPHWVAYRRKLAQRYQEGLKGVAGVKTPHFEGAAYQDSFQNYVVRAQRRDELKSFLKKEGVETLVSWPTPMWEHRGLALGKPMLPVSEQLCREVISLPLNPEVALEQVDYVSQTIRKFYSK